jgi:hypothetical protein
MLATPNDQSDIFGSSTQFNPSYHHPYSPKNLRFDDPPHVVDWLDITRKRSAHSIAEKTCEMVCYLWFAVPSSNPHVKRSAASATNSLQLVANPSFVHFMQKLLETTQVSQSVIVLSLHYIFRLKERNRFTAGQPGSEFRIAVAGLMMANKFLDE